MFVDGPSHAQGSNPGAMMTSTSTIIVSMSAEVPDDPLPGETPSIHVDQDVFKIKPFADLELRTAEDVLNGVVE